MTVGAFTQIYTGTIVDGVGSVGFPSSFHGYSFNIFQSGGGSNINNYTPYLSVGIAITTTSTTTPLIVSLTETGIPAGPGSVVEINTYNTAIFHSGTTAVTSTFYDLTDAAFGTQNSFYSSTLSLASASSSVDHVIRISVPFSITKTIVIRPSATGSHPTVSGEIDLIIPEPLSLYLLGTAITGLALARRFGRTSARLGVRTSA